MSQSDELGRCLETAVGAARAAGAVLRERFRTPIAVEVKAQHDFVTAVDRESEAVVVGRIRERHPDHAIVAEEGSPAVRSGGPRWIVDPLDGTTNFVHGIPTFSVSIGFADARGVAVGVIYDPMHDELFEAVRGRGARLDGRPIAASHERDLHRAVIATGFPFREFAKLDGYVAALRALMTATAGIRRAGSAAIDLAYAACGRYDGFFEVGLAPWDLAAGALIVAEAGGRVSDCAGGQEWLSRGDIIASGAAVYAPILEIVKPRLG